MTEISHNTHLDSSEFVQATTMENTSVDSSIEVNLQVNKIILKI